MNLEKLADYHMWANDRTRSVIKSLKHEEYEKDLVPPLGSIKAHIAHTILACEYNLKARIDGETVDGRAIFDKVSGKSIEDVCEHWRTIDEGVVSLASTHLDLDATFPNFLGEGTMQVNHDDFFMQYIIHTAYHRSQIMSAMRMLGKEAVGTDYLFYLSHLENE